MHPTRRAGHVFALDWSVLRCLRSASMLCGIAKTCWLRCTERAEPRPVKSNPATVMRICEGVSRNGFSSHLADARARGYTRLSLGLARPRVEPALETSIASTVHEVGHRRPTKESLQSFLHLDLSEESPSNTIPGYGHPVGEIGDAGSRTWANGATSAALRPRPRDAAARARTCSQERPGRRLRRRALLPHAQVAGCRCGGR